MPKKVAIIDAVFFIEGTGTVIALPNENGWTLDHTKEKICRRERIQIRIPNGGCISTFINNIEMINRGRERGGIAFILPSSIARKTSQQVVNCG